MKRVLIGNYSKTGTTTRVCDIIKAGLEETDFQVDVMKFTDVKDLEAYDTVILAAPINGMQWVEPARDFVKNNEIILKDKQIIVVYISYIIRTGSGFWKKKITKGVLSLTKSINPLSIKDFGGVIGDDFPGFARLIFGIPKGTSLDMSNDEEVISYTKELVKILS